MANQSLVMATREIHYSMCGKQIPVKKATVTSDVG
jgi:hypothetical protein